MLIKMSLVSNLMLIFVILFGLTSNKEVPDLSSNHAEVDPSDINMKSCGYLIPQNTTKTQSRIIEGNTTEKGEFPWHVAIYVKGQPKIKHICGGAFINKFWVLTAKQCFYPPNENPIQANQLKVSFGSIDIKDESYLIDVLSIFDHSYENTSLLRLKEVVLPLRTAQGSEYIVNYICLPKPMIINKYHEDAIVSGFGYAVQSNIPPNEKLRSARILIDPYSDCERRNLKSSLICGTESVHITCYEDLGSPLVQFEDKRAVLIGIVQPSVPYNGQVCGMGVLVFNRISYFVEWLKDYILNNVTTHPSTISTLTPTLTITEQNIDSKAPKTTTLVPNKEPDLNNENSTEAQAVSKEGKKTTIVLFILIGMVILIVIISLGFIAFFGLSKKKGPTTDMPSALNQNSSSVVSKAYKSPKQSPPSTFSESFGPTPKT